MQKSNLIGFELTLLDRRWEPNVQLQWREKICYVY